jgi:iron complex outermembrane recepter protein
MTMLRDTCSHRIQRRNFSFRITTALFLVAAYLMTSPPAHAGDLDTLVRFNIESQTLDKALLEFGAQAQIQIMFASNTGASSLRTPQLRGMYTGRQALQLLLKGTPLSFAQNGGTVEITLADDRAHTPSARPTSSSAPIPRITNTPTTGGQGITGGDDPPAPNDKGAGASLQEVLVTAQKYQQRAFNVPISLQVVTSSELEGRGITNLNALQYSVPGLTVEGGGVQRRIDIRGIGSAFGNGSLVGLYVDEADATPEGYAGAYGFGQLDAQTYDLARVEVLRGPQGTLYGDGSMGGVIRLITNQPVLNHFQMNSDVAALLTQDGAPSQRLQAMINTPLVTDSLGLRFAGEFDHEGGWIDEPAANVKNFNDENLVDLRIEGLWAPTTSLRVGATQIIHRNAFGPNQGEDNDGNFTQLYGLTTVPNGFEDYNLSNLTVKYDLGWSQLLSSFTHFTDSVHEYNSAETLPFGAITYWIYIPFNFIENEDSSEELRLSSSGSGPWHWTLGGFWKDYADNATQKSTLTLTGAPFPASLASSSTSTGSNSLSGFLDTSYQLMHHLTIGAGVRYFSDRETYTALGSPYQKATFTSTDPRLILQYQLTADINTYASAAKGFRSGGFNPAPFKPYDPESLRTYELGIKTRFPGPRIRANADVFYSHYSNIVVVGFLSPTNHSNVSTNAGNAHLRGFEADVNWQMTDEWNVGINGDYIDTYFVSAVAGGNYQVGDQLPFVSKYMVTADIDREFRMDGKQGYVRLDYSQVSPQTYRGHNNILDESTLIHMLNARANLQMSDNLSMGVFAHNLLNNRGYLDPLNLYLLASRPRPRTVGVDFRVEFP